MRSICFTRLKFWSNLNLLERKFCGKVIHLKIRYQHVLMSQSHNIVPQIRLPHLFKEFRRLNSQLIVIYY